MPRAQAQRNKPPQSEPKPWAWFIAGFFLGAFLMFMLYLGGILPEVEGAKTTAETTEQTKTAKSSQDKPARKSHFDFYTLLPENEVMAPDVPEYDPDDAARTSATRYMLQAGSFRRLTDADRLRARLILMGLNASIEKVSIANGEAWHRVQVGPFESRRDVKRAKAKLAGEGIESMVLKTLAEN